MSLKSQRFFENVTTVLAMPGGSMVQADASVYLTRTDALDHVTQQLAANPAWFVDITIANKNTGVLCTIRTETLTLDGTDNTRIIATVSSITPPTWGTMFPLANADSTVYLGTPGATMQRVPLLDPDNRLKLGSGMAADAAANVLTHYSLCPEANVPSYDRLVLHQGFASRAIVVSNWFSLSVTDYIEWQTNHAYYDGALLRPAAANGKQFVAIGVSRLPERTYNNPQTFLSGNTQPSWNTAAGHGVVLADPDGDLYWKRVAEDTNPLWMNLHLGGQQNMIHSLTILFMTGATLSNSCVINVYDALGSTLYATFTLTGTYTPGSYVTVPVTSSNIVDHINGLYVEVTTPAVLSAGHAVVRLHAEITRVSLETFLQP